MCFPIKALFQFLLKLYFHKINERLFEMTSMLSAAFKPYSVNKWTHLNLYCSDLEENGIFMLGVLFLFSQFSPVEKK